MPSLNQIQRAFMKLVKRKSRHPHQGKREKARRIRQLDAGIIHQNPYAK